ncbi:GIY-YIG nuclease family protein [Microbacterium protaetiae]|uniref:GIY-YIG nuclease family protein n=1 Tax=Microbacterium protaetiae TaxID=2509458 RepID=A0A4P6EBI6_9MICO|nr:GIY-YIG nuclease family protein [Microbacterium protaetiae]QAY59535.1 GIY-YIG nuclease family protein [Microbacterium protaetiae]
MDDSGIEDGEWREPEGELTDAEQLPATTPREEIAGILRQDASRMGDVYRLSVLDGLTSAEVAERLNIDTQGFVFSYRSKIDAILDGVVSSSPSVAKGAASALRAFIKRNRSELSAEAIRMLTEHLRRAEGVLDEVSGAESEELQSRSDEHDDDLASADLAGVAGIYAFSYGWYLERRADEKMGTTLIKVGRANDIGRRIADHRTGARAHMPEPLVVVRAYSASPDQDLLRLENAFHALLRTAGHINPRRPELRRNEVGKEWFMTNEAFLDAIASALGLRTAYMGSSPFVE